MGLKSKVERVSSLTKQYGVSGLINKSMERVFSEERKYSWEEIAPTDEYLAAQKRARFDYEPKISIVVPCYNTNPTYLRSMLESVLCQTYTKWELVIADASCDDRVAEVLTVLQNEQNEKEARKGGKLTIDEGRVEEESLHKSTQVILKKLSHNGGISINTNQAFEEVTGDFIGLLDHDDVLTPNALYEMVDEINKQPKEDFERLLLYSDEDKVTSDGSRYFYPHYKLDYNEELMRHYNYLCHFTLFSKGILEGVVGMDPDMDGAQDYDFYLRTISSGAKVVHVNKILYHWRTTAESTSGSAGNKSYASNAAVRAIGDYLENKGIRAVVEPAVDSGTYSVAYEINKSQEEVNELYAFALPGGAKSVSQNWQRILASYLEEDDVAIAWGRTVHNGKVLQTGLPHGYHGYMNRAVLPQDTEIFWNDAPVAYKKKALEEAGVSDSDSAFKTAEKLKKAGYRIVHVPFVEIKK